MSSPFYMRLDHTQTHMNAYYSNIPHLYAPGQNNDNNGWCWSGNAILAWMRLLFLFWCSSEMSFLAKRLLLVLLYFNSQEKVAVTWWKSNALYTTTIWVIVSHICSFKCVLLSRQSMHLVLRLGHMVAHKYICALDRENAIGKSKATHDWSRECGWFDIKKCIDEKRLFNFITGNGRVIRIGNIFGIVSIFQTEKKRRKFKLYWLFPATKLKVNLWLSAPGYMNITALSC